MYLNSLSDKVITIHSSDPLSDNTNKLYSIGSSLYFDGLVLGSVDTSNAWVNANDHTTYTAVSGLVDTVQANVDLVYSSDRTLEGNTHFANGKVGIGVSNPSALFHLIGEDDHTARVQIDQYNTGDDAPDILGKRAKGDADAPTSTDSDDRFFRLNSQVYDGSTWQLAGSLRWDANGTDATPNSVFAIQTRSSDITEDRIAVLSDGAVKLSNAFQLPSTDGANGQALITDGSGILTWQDVAMDTTPLVANTYNTYVTLSGLVDDVQDNVAALPNSAANDHTTYTTLSGLIDDVQDNVAALPNSAANDHITYTSLTANLYNTWVTVNTAIDLVDAGSGATTSDIINGVNSANANIYNTYVTVSGLIDTVQSNVTSIDSSFIETNRPAETIINVNSATGSVYTFIGDGFPSASSDNPDIYVTRGKTYKINNSSYASHPLAIRVSNGGSAYSNGVSGAGTAEVLFTVPMDAPEGLVYQCTSHASMLGNVIVGGGSSVGSASLTVSNTAPSSPSDGNLWYDSSDGYIYVYVQDPDSSQWVQPLAGASGTGAGSVNVDALAPSSNLTGHVGNVALTYATGSINNLTVTNDLLIHGKTTLKTGVIEGFSNITGATGVTAHDCSNGHIFRHTAIAANFTVNFTNLGLTNDHGATVALLLIQGSTSYIPTAVQIGGVSQTILWQGGSSPSGTNSGTDIVTFSIIQASGTYTVLGNLISYS